MSELRSALLDLLETDKQLKELATGGFWYDVGDERTNTKPPYVIVGKPAGTPSWAFQGNSQDWEVWLIKGVGPVKIAEAIDERCKELLTDAELTMEGRDLQYLRPMGDVNYPEVVDGERYQHVGANYRITSERRES